jgi:membrane fusion protein (multidrug efflux system)
MWHRRLGVVVGVLLILLQGLGCKPKGEAAGAVPALRAHRMVTGEVPVYAEFVGTLSAINTVELRTKVSGLLEKQMVRDGASVKAGQPLFVIDRKSCQAAANEAKARFTQLAVAADNAAAALGRMRELWNSQIASKQQLDDGIAAERMAVSNRDAAKAALEQASLSLADTVIRAPIDGVMGEAMVRPGGLVQAGQTLLATISDMNSMALRIGLPEQLYLSIGRPEGKETWVKDPKIQLLLSDGSTYPRLGKITFMDRALEAGTGTLMLKVEFPNPEGLLKPGLSGKVRIEYEIRPKALLVPQQAVLEVLGKMYVFRVNGKDLVEQVPIVIGPASGTSWIVESGLNPGDMVLVEGIQMVQSGMQVKPVLVLAASGS